MKVFFFEGEHGSEISMEAETLEEASALARMTLNAKATKPEIRNYFNEKEITCSVWIPNVKQSVRRSSISNQKR